MTQVTYPGVYIQEVPSGVRTIAPVSTSVCAFVDFFREGPMNEAVEIDGKAGFDRVFGGLHRDSEASYAIDQFFTNGGTKAYVVRVAGGTPAVASVTIRSQARAGVAQIDLLSVRAANAGAWGNNLRIHVSHNADGTFNLGVTRFAGTDAAAKIVAAEPPFLNLSIDPNSPRYVEKVVNDASVLVQVDHLAPADDRLPAANGTAGREITLDAAAIAALHPNNKTFTVTVTDPGPAADPTVAHTATLDFDNTPANPAPTTAKALRAKVESAIQTAVDAQGATPPLLAGATVQLIETTTGYRFVVEPNRKAREFTPQLILDVTAAGTSTGAEALGLAGNGVGDNVQDYQVGSTLAAGSQAAGVVGDDGGLPGKSALAGAPGEPPTGMYALAKIDLFNLLCLPRASSLQDAEADALIGDALTFCEEHRAMLLVDIPADRNTVQEILDWIDDNANYRHPNSVLYFPRVRIADPLDEFRLRSIGASGDGGRHLRAHRRDARRVEGAGRPRGDAARRARRSTVKLTDPRERHAQPARRQLPAHVPDLRPGRAGARARWTAPTRRRRSGSTSRSAGLALFIEESLFRGTKWVVFEPNDEPLWAQIRLNVGAFMMSLFRQGAFQGTTPRQGVLRQVRRRDDDRERSQPRHREHRGRVRAAQAGRVRRHQDPADPATSGRKEDTMANGFTVNAHRVDPYKNFKFRLKWDGKTVLGVSKVGPLKRTTEVVRASQRRRQQPRPQVARPHQHTKRSRSSEGSPTTRSSSAGRTWSTLTRATRRWTSSTTSRS